MRGHAARADQIGPDQHRLARQMAEEGTRDSTWAWLQENLDAVLARIDETLPEATDRLIELLRIPSISTDPAYKSDCARAADWLVADLRSLGFEAAARPTPGHPMVVGRKPGPGQRIAGHNQNMSFYSHCLSVAQHPYK
mgnify:CR=1 FL=1